MWEDVLHKKVLALQNKAGQQEDKANQVARPWMLSKSIGNCAKVVPWAHCISAPQFANPVSIQSSTQLQRFCTRK